MRAYIRTVTYAVQIGFILAGVGFFAILLPELHRLSGEQHTSEFREKLFAGIFALAVCITGVTGAFLTRRFLLKRY